MNHHATQIDLECILPIVDEDPPAKPENPEMNWTDTIQELLPTLRERSAAADQSDNCAVDSIHQLRDLGVHRALIPTELGGLDMSHPDMCDLLRHVAHGCPSTALTTSMHQHLVAVEVWKYRNGKTDGATLKAVVENNWILVSTGAKDWIASNGELTKTDGGYLLNGRKSFASGSAIGDRFVTSALHGDEVFHFSVPFNADGVTVKNEWFASGMRGTGSDTIVLEDVFVPEDAIALRRPRGEWHPVWNVVATHALPLIVSIYVGIAERARDIVVDMAAKKPESAALHQQIGELERSLTTCRIAWESMVNLCTDNPTPDASVSEGILSRKTIAIEAAVETVERTLEFAGGFGYLRRSELEKLHRDVIAGRHHPLPARRQAEFSGRMALGLPPINAEA